MEHETRRSKGINSIEVGYRVLEAIQEGPGSVPLKTIAERASLSPSAAHNYLASFIRTGMVRPDGRGQYALGPSLAALGMTAVRQMDTYELVEGAALRLRDATDLGVAVLIWTEAGTVIIYNRPGSPEGPFELRNGLVSTAWTGGGNVFIAYLERELTTPVVERELGVSHDECTAVMKSIATNVRNAGYAICDLKQIPDYRAISAPVWNSDGTIAYALTLTAHKDAIDTSPTGPHVTHLVRAAAQLSHTLGAPQSVMRQAVE
ncbi:IclR family transcriptional regulator [Rhodococcus opacus]|uniref:IclR family transcriptional regulator n=1 Tax=Rhodococcus opacus TaxID=37919 RepID=A0A076F0D2_RHOOP|nr:helix-turn-helix domain-containing protein [Rhodococcus opacus]AII11456.1 hypothetical protein EP51_46590 [Rhodococcus opacus]